MNKKLEFNELKLMFEQGSMDENSLKHYVKNDRISQEQYNDIIGKNTLEDKYKDNPLIRCQEKYYHALIFPNQKQLQNEKALINTTIIKNLFKESLRIYEGDNKLYYLDIGSKLIEYEPKDQYDIINKYYKNLDKIVKLILPLHILAKVKPVKQVISNYDIIKFRDGLYNIKTGEKLEEIKNIEDIPSCHIDVRNNFNPSSKDLKRTKKIITHMFVKPKDFIYRCKDIYFNREHLKGFSVIYGEKHSGKTSVVQNILLKKLFNNRTVGASNFNRVLERQDLQTNGLSLFVDETQDKIMDSSFLNEFSGNKTVHISRKNTTGIDIKTTHVFLAGENVPELHNATDGTYARVYLIETHNDIRELGKQLLNYIETPEFIDTIYYMIKESYKKNPEITEQNIDVTKYNEKKKDITTILARYIYSTPKDNLGYSEEFGNLNPQEIQLINRAEQKPLDTSETGYRLSLNAVKELINIFNEQGLLDKHYDTSKMSRQLSMNILPSIIEDYDNSYEKQLYIKGTRIKIKLDIAPTTEALEILQEHGLNIEHFHLMNKL